MPTRRTTVGFVLFLVSLAAPSIALAQAAPQGSREPTSETVLEGTEASAEGTTEPASAPGTSTGPALEVASSREAEPAPTTTEDSTEPDAPPARPPLVYHLVIDVGFSHWLGHTFDAPAGIYTPALTIHAVPLTWLEVVLHYTGSAIEFTIPTAERTSHVGFAELSLVLRRELRNGGDLVMLGCGPMVGVVYNVLGAGVVFGAEIVGRYLIQLGTSLAVGPFIDVRATFYELPGDPRPFYEIRDGKILQGHLDAHIQLGASLAF